MATAEIGPLKPESMAAMSRTTCRKELRREMRRGVGPFMSRLRAAGKSRSHDQRRTRTPRDSRARDWERLKSMTTAKYKSGLFRCWMVRLSQYIAEAYPATKTSTESEPTNTQVSAWTEDQERQSRGSPLLCL